MITFLVNLIGVLLITFIIWWFLIKKPQAKTIVKDTIDILVKDGVYEPSIIRGQSGKKLQLRFLRKDATPCAEVVIFDSFNISAKLPLDKPHTIDLRVEKPGEYKFTCQMGMYQGKLIIE